MRKLCSKCEYCKIATAYGKTMGMCQKYFKLKEWDKVIILQNRAKNCEHHKEN
jgi:hypothetical protein